MIKDFFYFIVCLLNFVQCCKILFCMSHVILYCNTVINSFIIDIINNDYY